MRLSFRRSLFAAAIAMSLANVTVSVAAKSASSPASAGVAGMPSIHTPSEGYFFVGGHWEKEGDKDYQVGQMYVQYLMPKHQRHPNPIVLVHGTAQTGVNFLGTPDGREGWAQYYADQGYKVYVVDQVGRGRSGTSTEEYGKYARLSAYDMESIYTGQENYNLFPQAKLHTQWPGGAGVIGNPSFDQYFASQVPFIADGRKTEELVDPALIALLEKVGPSILVVHSQAGVFGYKVADERPDLVAALVEIEPNGPGFYDPDFVGGENWYKYGAKIARPYGITRVPLKFDPPVKDASDLNPTEEAQARGPGQVRCYLQGEPARQLPNLAKTPISIFTSESSFRATVDDCESAFLTQAGVPNDNIHLADLGIHGNGHMMFLEKNNLQVAAAIQRWIETHEKK